MLACVAGQAQFFLSVASYKKTLLILAMGFSLVPQCLAFQLKKPIRTKVEGSQSSTQTPEAAGNLTTGIPEGKIEPEQPKPARELSKSALRTLFDPLEFGESDQVIAWSRPEICPERWI